MTNDCYSHFLRPLVSRYKEFVRGSVHGTCNDLERDLYCTCNILYVLAGKVYFLMIMLVVNRGERANLNFCGRSATF